MKNDNFWLYVGIIFMNIMLLFVIYSSEYQIGKIEKQAIEYGYAKYDSSKEFKWIKPLNNGEKK